MNKNILPNEQKHTPEWTKTYIRMNKNTLSTKSE